ncbi:MAG: hypothetical protein ACRDSL_14510, partial [Pseudonocardiaceae bacterium]
YTLPPADAASGRTPEERGFSLVSLAWVLRTALAPIGEIRTKHVTCVRRTTPSGGARHPTELAVVLAGPLGEVPGGTYTYDIASHTLVAERSDVHRTYVRALDGHEFGLVVRTRVERPMWRYRDLRALRPVLIDAGHVVEVVTFLLGQVGVSTRAISPPMAPAGVSWLEEPEVVLVRPWVAGEDEPRGRAASQQGRSQVPENADAYLTNPAVVLRFGQAMYASALWPSVKDTRIDFTDFLILNHCLPSSRNDRDTSVAGILAAVPSASAAAIERLRDGAGLLPVRDAEVLYGGGNLWVRHEWYMALLAYLEALSYGVERPVTSRIHSDFSYIGDIGVVTRRHTSRTFSSAALSWAHVDQLLRRVFANVSHPGLDISLVAWNVRGLDLALYRWRGGELSNIGEAPMRDAVTANSAGQTAVSSGALAMWVSIITDVSRPERYVMDLVDLGRLGQRICLAATDLDMAVFLTPAVHDRGTCSLLDIGDADCRLTYVFGLGVDAPSTT